MTDMPSDDIKIFKDKLANYKQLIDDDIADYAKKVQKSTLANYGEHSLAVANAYLDILGRGGKRVRGALVTAGYEMSGGKNQHMILQAARAIEMLHAYILIIDDIQDRSPTRRGGPSAHKLLADYHLSHKLAGDPEHFGISMALNAALGGVHAAQIILANLPTNEEDRIKVFNIVNLTMVVTAQGQVGDIMNEVSVTVDANRIEQVLEWKTARYSFINPLHVGMVLAGADCHATDGITAYASHTGKAFQITDDILGTFGNESDSGKSPLDDTREGKRTVLTAYALEQAAANDKRFLLSMLGNPRLTTVEFEKCKKIITESGALAYAQKQAEQHVAKALAALDKEKTLWTNEGVTFLRGLAQFLLIRQT